MPSWPSWTFTRSPAAMALFTDVGAIGRSYGQHLDDEAAARPGSRSWPCQARVGLVAWFDGEDAGLEPDSSWTTKRRALLGWSRPAANLPRWLHSSPRSTDF
ncbi:MAG: hypothetical protein IPO29_08865 [Anaerolineae bacterium]|nr:hypothetical protein [Anaerolineae bacterium]